MDVIYIICVTYECLINNMSIKMKKILALLLVSVFFAFNANALNLKDVTTDLDSKSSIKTASLTKSLSGSQDLSNMGEKISKMAEEKVDEAVSRVEDKINNQVEELKKKADEQVAKVENMMKKAEEQLNFVEKLKAKAMSYVKMGMIVAVIVLLGLMVIVFIMWKIWKTVKNIASLKFIINHKKYEEKLKMLEKEVMELKKAVGLRTEK